ncbi:TrkH family potassium uptake protein [Mycolicibacter longobardus]|uniref:ATPase n=1 Tax=Mycolicibacter longobardus TaxID=1108812 RepID=A0A1X1YQT9_9MYCO|nr:potassium transporter TrkG [Mycolicibacter longobardus]ORW13412.1 ATPase [Mycolicibacter longobardus]
MAGTAERFHPGRVIMGSFAVAIAIGSGLLMLPEATETGTGASVLDAVFTATSAVCVTGLITVDTSTYWSAFGEVVILVLIQLGGLGIMTVASLMVVLLSRRLGLRARLVAQAQIRTLTPRDVGRVVRNVIIFSLASEAIVAAILVIRWATNGPFTVRESLWHGVFHSVSAFNNAGFSLNADSLVGSVGDAWIMLTVCAAVIVGGLGFPVVFELARAWRHPRAWSVTTKLTVSVTVTLLIVGTVVIAATERHNPATLGALPTDSRMLAAVFTATMPRTAGFNAVDIGAMSSEGLLFTDLLMFIGGGSASTAGGIKVTTFGLLAVVLWAEMRGESRVNVGVRQVPADNQRQALAVAVLFVGVSAVATLTLLTLTDFSLDQVLFETVSALSTVGLSTGITADLPDAAEWLLIVLMYVGRLGPLTLASALALRHRERRYERPAERTIVG